MREIIDNLVIGGGPAGTAAAIQLAQAGKGVTLLERKQEPHDKVCGEFISWEAADYLTALGIDLPALGAEPITNLRLVNGGESIEAALPFTAWSLSRRRLDAAMLQRAELAGVKVHCGAAAKNLQRRDGYWQASVRTEGSSQFYTELHADSVFLATGKYDLRQWQRRKARRTDNRIGFKMHLYLSPNQQMALQHTVELHLFDHGYAGIEPVEGGKANLCFLINKDVFHRCGKRWPDLLEWLRRSSPHLRTRLTGAVQIWSQPLAVYGTPYGYLHRSQAGPIGLYRLGDQMAVIPSLAGDGIAIALYSGLLAAELHVRNDAERYHREALKRFRRPVRSAQIVSGLLSTTKGRRLALWLASRKPALLAGVIRRTRLQGPDQLACRRSASPV
jgi:flavin-dependent dehydrogenase